MSKQWPIFTVILWGAMLLISCSETPSGPDIPEVKKLGVYCALNPKMPAQTIYVGHTLTYQQIINKETVDTEVDDAEISISGPDGLFQINNIPVNTTDTDQTELSTGGYLSGSSGFNYIGTEQNVSSGERYSITVEADDFGILEAETLVPGDFEITHINIDPNLVEDSHYEYENAPDPVVVKWSESENAAGYLVDISMIVYKVPFELQHNKYLLSLPLLWPEDTFFDMVYSAEPVDFAIKYDNSFQRGFLTKKNSMAIKRDLFLEMIKFIDDYYYRRANIKRMLISVHAVDQAFYNFLSFQFAQHAEEQMIGQESLIPDISNVKNGVGVFGSYVSRVKECRQIEYILQTYQEYDSYRATNKNEIYENLALDLFKDEDPKIELSDDNNSELLSEDKIKLSWNSSNTKYKWFVLVLKPRYLWFSPGTMSYYVNGNSCEFSWEDFPVRDCQVEWYVKALLPNYNIDATDLSMALSPHKALQVADNLDFTEWSESGYFSVSSGMLDDFENRSLQFVSPQSEQVVETDCTLEWSPVENADGYLIAVRNADGALSVLFSENNQIQPCTAEQVSFVEGLDWCSGFQSGQVYSCRVCALRVKTGTLGFTIQADDQSGELKLSPRYQHPSGIVQKSQWSDEIRISVQ